MMLAQAPRHKWGANLPRRLRTTPVVRLYTPTTYPDVKDSKGSNSHGLPQDKPWDTLISNVATQPKHHAYIVSRALTDSGHCDSGQSRQINQPITLKTVA
jgi:hypothetical protein